MSTKHDHAHTCTGIACGTLGIRTFLSAPNLRKHCMGRKHNSNLDTSLLQAPGLRPAAVRPRSLSHDPHDL